MKKLKLERKYEQEVKRFESMEKLKKIEQARLASEKEFSEKLFDYSVKLDQKNLQSQQRALENQK